MENSDTFKKWLEDLKSAEPRVRGKAAMELGRSLNPKALGPLLEALKDTNEPARMMVINALGSLKQPAAVEPLLSLLQSGGGGLTATIALALGSLGDARAIAPIADLMRRGSPQDRKFAAHALGRIKDARSVDPLLRALSDTLPEVAAAAAEALGWLRTPRGAGPLVQALRDEESAVRTAAAAALLQIRSPKTLPALIGALRDRAPQVRIAAVRALEEWDVPEAIEPLIGALRDEDPGVRAAVAEALRRRPDTRSREALKPICSADPDPAVRKAAEEAHAYLEDYFEDQSILEGGPPASPGRKREIPMYAVREMSDMSIVLETRGSRYAGSAIFLIIGIIFAAVVIIEDSMGFRLFCAAVAAASTATSALIFFGKERIVLDARKGTAEYTNQLRASKNRVARFDEVAIVDVRSETARIGAGRRRSTRFYVLELVMVDGRRLLVNKSANESSLRDLALRVAAMRDRAAA